MEPQHESSGEREERMSAGRDRTLRIALGIRRLGALGGLENLCLQVAAALMARGHELTIFTAGEPVAAPAKVVYLNDSVRAYTNHGRMEEFAAAFGQATGAGFDRVVAFQPMPADILVSADSLFDKPDTAFLKRYTPRFRTYSRLEAQCLAGDGGAYLIGLDDKQVKAFAAHYSLPANRCAVLPPTLDPGCRRPLDLSEAERRELRARFGVSQDRLVLLWIGLQPMTKGLDRLVDVLATMPEAELLVCGLAETARKVQPILRRAQRAGTAGRVHCLGFLRHDDERFFEVLRASDVLAHPARVETTGTVILEAIVNGLPAVTSELCGFSDHVRRANAGIVIDDPFDAEHFRRALVEVSAERARYGANGIAYGASEDLYQGVARAVEMIEAGRVPAA